MNVGVRLFAEEDATAVAALIRTTLLTSNAADYPREELETIAEWYSAEGWSVGSATASASSR